MISRTHFNGIILFGLYLDGRSNLFALVKVHVSCCLILRHSVTKKRGYLRCWKVDVIIIVYNYKKNISMHD